jgi:hypothetical protein
MPGLVVHPVPFFRDQSFRLAGAAISKLLMKRV